MNVSEQLTRAFIYALYAQADPRSDEAVQRALETVLANVPEPDKVLRITTDLIAAKLRVQVLEAKLTKVSDAHARYQRNDLSQEEFEGTIAEIAEAKSCT